jgi:hypothetical protein
VLVDRKAAPNPLLLIASTVGGNALTATTKGTANTAEGFLSLFSNSTGSNNTATRTQPYLIIILEAVILA